MNKTIYIHVPVVYTYKDVFLFIYLKEAFIHLQMKADVLYMHCTARRTNICRYALVTRRAIIVLYNSECIARDC